MKSVDAAVERLRAAFDPARAAAIARVFDVRFVGDARHFVLDLAATPPTLVEGTAPPGSPSIGIHPDDVDDLIAKRTTPRALFSTGRLRVFSGMAEAMLLDGLF